MNKNWVQFPRKSQVPNLSRVEYTLKNPQNNPPKPPSKAALDCSKCLIFFNSICFSVFWNPVWVSEFYPKSAEKFRANFVIIFCKAHTLHLHNLVQVICYFLLKILYAMFVPELAFHKYNQPTLNFKTSLFI